MRRSTGLSRHAATRRLTITLVAGTALALSAPAVATAQPSRVAAQPAVHVTRVTPADGPTGGGSVVTVRGSGFVDVRGVRFGATWSRAVRTVNSTTLTATAPAHVASVTDVRVEIAGNGRSVLSDIVLADRFTYRAAPSVRRIDPATGPLAGGTSVTVSGTGFATGDRVSVGGRAATVLSASSTALVVRTPAAPKAGVADVRVASAYGTSAVGSADRYTYVAPPDTTPPHPVTSATAVAQGPTTIKLSWTPPTDSDLAGVVIRRSQAPLPADSTPTDGDAVTTAAPGATSFVDSGLGSTATYHYVLFAVDSAGNASGGVPISADTPSYDTPAPVTGLTATLTGQKVDLSWTNSTTPGASDTVIRRAVGAVAPASPYDGESVSPVLQYPASSPTGPTRTVEQDALVPGTTYSYSVFALNPDEVFAPAATVTVQVADAPAGTLTWQPHTYAEPVIGDLTKVGCPTTSFCLATGDHAYATYDGRTWSTPAALPADFVPQAISCVGPTFCMVLGGEQSRVFDGSTWSAPVTAVPFPAATTPTTDDALSCSSADFCLALFAGGTTTRWDGTRWATAAPYNTGAPGFRPSVHCFSPTYCVSASNLERHWDGSRWIVDAAVDLGRVLPMSCPSSDYCLAVDESGRGVEFDGTTWRATSVPGLAQNASVTSVACLAAGDCFVLTRYPSAVAIRVTNGVWGSPQTLDYSRVADAYLACPTASACEAVVNSTTVNAVAYRGGVWSSAHVVADYHSLVGASCGAASSCTAVDDRGAVTTYDGTSWSVPTTVDTAGYPSAISCHTADFCAVVDRSGNAVVETDGAWGPSVPVDPGTALIGVSCPAVGFCVAVESLGKAAVYRDGQWSAATQAGTADTFYGISCASTTYCVASGSVYDGSSWEPYSYKIAGFASCVAPGTCVAVNSTNGVVDSTTFSAQGVGDGRFVRSTPYYPNADTLQALPTALSCVSTALCVYGDSYGTLTQFSADGSGPVTLGGEVLDGFAEAPPVTVSCASASSCLVVYQDGSVQFGRA